jgi:Gpi18-like mannosyltransferase
VKLNSFLELKRGRINKDLLAEILFMLAVTLLAIWLRTSLLDYKSGDYFAYTKTWFIAIQTQGIAALKSDFSNYTPPYLYLLYLMARFFPGLTNVVAIKIPSVLADFVCAGFIYRIVQIKNPKMALFAYAAVLFAPTVFMNGSFWGQADSIFTTALIACIYFLLKQKNSLAFLSFGIAFAFKLQAIFLMPFLIGLLLKRTVSWRHFLLIPAVYFISIVPAWMIGRPLNDLLGIYLSQSEQYGRLTKHAPTFYSWLPDPDLFMFFFPAGLAIAGGVILLYLVSIYRSSTKITSHRLIGLALLSLLLTPFFLPKMHDRYFFPADVLSIAFGFYVPGYFFVPVMINMISFFAYQPFLFGRDVLPMPILAMLLAVTIILLIRKLASPDSSLLIGETDPGDNKDI